MRDPEGNEFCAFLREMSCRPTASTASSSTPPTPSPGRAVVGRGARRRVTDNAEHGGGWWTVLGATDDPVLTMDFVPVPEPKTVKNRLHWDVVGTVEEFLDRGATHLWDRPRWTVLADPEGNEFCVFPESK